MPRPSGRVPLPGDATHTGALLGEAGLPPAHIESLREQGVIA